MGKKDEDKLRHDLDLHRAMALDKYREPEPIDIDKALAASQETNRFGTKVAQGYTSDTSGYTVRSPFSKRSAMLTYYEDPVLAMIAKRNALAREFAEKLLVFDDKISAVIAGSGLSGPFVVERTDGAKADDPTKTVGANSLAAIGDPTVRAMVLAWIKKNGKNENSNVAVTEALAVVEAADSETKAELKEFADKEWLDADDPTKTDAAKEAAKAAEDRQIETEAAKKPPRKKTPSAKPAAPAKPKRKS